MPTGGAGAVRAEVEGAAVPAPPGTRARAVEAPAAAAAAAAAADRPASAAETASIRRRVVDRPLVAAAVTTGAAAAARPATGVSPGKRKKSRAAAYSSRILDAILTRWLEAGHGWDGEKLRRLRESAAAPPSLREPLAPPPPLPPSLH